MESAAAQLEEMQALQHKLRSQLPSLEAYTNRDRAALETLEKKQAGYDDTIRKLQGQLDRAGFRHQVIHVSRTPP